MDQKAEWLEWRRQGVGASDIAAAYTGSYGGAYSVVAKKLRLKANEIKPGLAERGLRWEQPVADAVHAITGYYVHGEQLLVEHVGDARYRATLDGLVAEAPEITFDDAVAVLEIKTVGAYARPNWDYYNAQVQWQMFVTGKARALLALATIGLDLDSNETATKVALYWHEADPYKQEALTRLADELLDAVEAKRPPAPDKWTDLADVKAVNAEAAEAAEAVDLDDIQAHLDAYILNKADAKAATEAMRDAEKEIRHAIGTAREGQTSSGLRVRVGTPIRRFTSLSEEAAAMAHPEFTRQVFDRERFKNERPAAYDEFKIPTPDRRITVKNLEEDNG